MGIPDERQVLTVHMMLPDIGLRKVIPPSIIWFSRTYIFTGTTYSCSLLSTRDVRYRSE